MERNIEDAVKLYSGDKPFGLFAQRLHKNLSNMNFIYKQINDIFEQAGIKDFERNPIDMTERKKFADLFRQFNDYLEAAKIQGFTWKQLEYSIKDDNTGEVHNITVLLDETTYLILVLRYKELFTPGDGPGGGDIPYDIDGYITTIDTDKIDSDYMNSRFEKYLKLLHADGSSQEELKKAEDELHKTFATLTQEEQKYANIFLHDIQSGDVEVLPGKTFREYVIEYVSIAKNDQIHRLSKYILGVDEDLLRNIMSQHITEDNINEFGRFDALKATADKTLAKKYFDSVTGMNLPIPKVNIRIDNLLRDFILKGGYDIDVSDLNS